MLEDDGDAMITAADGDEALENAIRFGPRLVILDGSLRVVGGETAAAVRQVNTDDRVARSQEHKHHSPTG